ncbi:GMC family oxidoreductase [Pseudothauera nasutitermitis]|uniref:GMC family oxidoreductase n=1 Tax=Pseudothauera nasutitermitis TaxID=2565930 RepID=A0A4S4B4I4_9RHOO|nr:GMC family oxidoreductase N-terminal domain-containing protein [Pseudothauera nasutitermitis]THF66670.1 GMC family oxidoreductase [Pseudothauera nasutitermitis]
MPPGETFDFIVVGGGSAGAAVAARLAERPEFRVLLLEAGQREPGVRFRLPVLTPFALAAKRGVRNYRSAPEPALRGREIVWPRGQGLGGCSLVNGMLWVRGDPDEYDQWAAQGCTGWAYRDLLDHFRRSEAYPGGDPAQRGADGAVSIERRRPSDALTDAFLTACRNQGVPLVADYNAGVPEGAAYLQFNLRNGLRHANDRAYLKDAAARNGLVIRRQASATRILLDGRRAVGVEYATAVGLQTVAAAREIIVACGTIQSPQLLELSGIGQHEVLARNGIPTRLHLPGVGENLRDHLNTRVGLRTTFRGGLNDVQHSWIWKMKAAAQWLARREGPLAMIGATAHAWVRTRKELARADAKIQLLHYSAGHQSGNLSNTLDRHPGFSLSSFVLRPASTGAVHIRSKDFAASPAITANYLTHEADVETTIGAFHFIRRLIGDETLAGFITDAGVVLASLETDARIIDWVRSTGLTSYHPIGTCKMGTDALAVVDPQLKVIGVDGLRIADASIMPSMPSSNTHAPAVMIGEKAASLVLAAHGARC